ncbi:EthD family reductase [Amycolatopsis vastitatis]|uniref:EthD domain-containing protein n=1 Tax=Amycolatopsis vastitatis TaxID=1905142 RepID=A0A229T2I6_9PSEU|nr:EthD family reductase [Amycolatopsis vastitatis]OXM65303.1 hypothetical protein CF165_23515 [Amycolatopsis vastitatis]
MTARFVVLYDTPSDVEAFERHYNDVHIPLAKQIPGLTFRGLIMQLEEVPR